MPKTPLDRPYTPALCNQTAPHIDYRCPLIAVPQFALLTLVGGSVLFCSHFVGPPYTAEDRQLKHDCPPSPPRRKHEHEHKSSYIHP